MKGSTAESVAPNLASRIEVTNKNYYNIGTNEGYFPDFNYFFHTYGSVPFYVKGTGTDILDKHFYPWLKETYPDLKLLHIGGQFINKKNNNERYTFEIPSIKTVLTVQPKDKRIIEGSNLSFYIHYKDEETSKEFFESIQKFIKRINVGVKDSISLIIQDGQSLDVTSFEVKIGEIDIALNYGDDFVPVYNKIINRLNTKNDKGLVLLHGIPGTGKTSLLKYLCKVVKKEVLFIPPSMAESITSPGFIPFMMEHPNSILIIEDAERILLDREASHGNQGVSNVLNISDGILGDCLNVQIVATFNTKKDRLDQALLRKGRLIAEYEFKALNIDHSNRLLEQLGKTHRTKKPLTLTEIYNIEEEEFRTQKERTSIGFNSK